MRYMALVDGKAGAFGVVFPDLPGCTAMGATVDEALAEAVDALRVWGEAVLAQGGRIPEPRPVEALLADPEVQTELGTGAFFAQAPMILGAGRPVKANLSLDPGVLAALDEAAKRRGVTRSALVELLAREHLHALL